MNFFNFLIVYRAQLALSMNCIVEFDETIWHGDNPKKSYLFRLVPVSTLMNRKTYESHGIES